MGSSPQSHDYEMVRKTPKQKKQLVVSNPFSVQMGDFDEKKRKTKEGAPQIAPRPSDSAAKAALKVRVDKTSGGGTRVLPKQAPPRVDRSTKRPIEKHTETETQTTTTDTEDYSGTCCGKECAVCCGPCCTKPDGGWRLLCNHVKNVKAYLGSMMVKETPVWIINMFLLLGFITLWALEDVGTQSSITLSWNSHIIFSPLYCLLLMGTILSIYQSAGASANKSYVWAVIWFLGMLISSVFFRQSREHVLDSDPILYRAFRYSAWTMQLGAWLFLGILHCFHLSSGAYAEVAASFKSKVEPRSSLASTKCQRACGSSESISVYLQPMSIGSIAVFVLVFLMWITTLIFKLFEDVTPTTIESFSNFNEGAFKAHTIMIPFYTMITLLMITSIIDAAVFSTSALGWAALFYAGIGGAVALIRHSNIHINDEDRLQFDALRISGWTLLGVCVGTLMALHAARLENFKKQVENLDETSPIAGYHQIAAEDDS
jgi:hypothetical protein